MRTAIALVGRPNVGKSRLFNRLIGHRRSIVHDQPGVTRDVIFEEIGHNIVLMDTGGMGLSSVQEKTEITDAVEDQIAFAINAADVIFFVVDARAGCTPGDYEIAFSLRKANKKIFLVANKVDSESELHRCDAFHGLGMGQPIAVSAEHGYGEADLRAIIEKFDEKIDPEVTLEAKNCIKICLAGRPNVGKSSIANALLKENRSITTPIAGTTRDIITSDLNYQYNGKSYFFQLVDTAGLRAKKKIDSSVEFFSSLRANDAVSTSDVVFFIIDALTGITKQDKKLIGQILEQGKCLVSVVNKWDLAQEGIKNDLVDGYTSVEDFQQKFSDAICKELSTLIQFPIIFVSAKNKSGIESVLQEGIRTFERASQVVSTGKLNRTIQDLVEHQPPAIVSGKRFKIYYTVQTGNFPFRLKIFCNRSQRLTDTYERYMENGIRYALDMKGCPLRFEFIDKESRYSEKTA